MIPDEARVWPDTRPDDAALSHAVLCKCDVCLRPQARWYKKKKVRLLNEQDGTVTRASAAR